MVQPLLLAWKSRNSWLRQEGWVAGFAAGFDKDGSAEFECALISEAGE